MSPKKIAGPLDIYIRVSDTRGRSGDSFISPKDQEERCRALAKARTYQVGEVFKELDVSGGKMKRPELDRAIARIEDGVSAGVIVAKLDRFARTLVGGLQTLDRINALGGAVIVADGEFDTSTATGELVLNMMLSLGQFELRRIKETWAGAKRHAVLTNGIHISPNVPPGYVRGEDRRLAPDPKHGVAITEAFTRAAHGEKYNRIAAYLTEVGLPSGEGAIVWEPNRIKRLLANRAYLGEARNGHGDVNPNAHPPLTDPLTWNIAQRPSSGPTINNQATRMLAGLCRCASCSYAMRSQAQRADTVGSYRCRTTSPSGRCEHPATISQTRLEDYVIAQFLTRVAEVKLQEVVADDEFELAGVAANEAERRYRDVLEDVALSEQIGAEDHRHMVAAYHAAWQKALAAVPAPSRTTIRAAAEVDIAALVEELIRRDDMQSLRELLATQIQAVFVRPAASRARNLPIEDRVRIVWADEPQLELPKRGERFEPRPYAWAAGIP